MTTAVSPTRSRSALWPPAAAAGVLAFALMLVMTYLDTPFKASGSGRWAINTDLHPVSELPFLALFAVLGTAVVFGVVVRRGLARPASTTAKWALAAAVVGVVSIPVFWTGLPVVLAAGTAVLALDARTRDGRLGGVAGAALVVASLLTVGTVWLALAG